MSFLTAIHIGKHIEPASSPVRMYEGFCSTFLQSPSLLAERMTQSRSAGGRCRADS